MPQKKLNLIEMPDARSWRAWLRRNHKTVDEIWLVYYKTDKKHDMIDYEASVEEALCYGWIDSLVRKLDDVRYARKFTPRKPKSVWSDLNKKRVAKLIKEKRMTKIGQALIDAAKVDGSWDDKPPVTKIALEIHPDFGKALDKNKKARTFFDNLAPSHRKRFIQWINAAKRDATRERRIKEAIEHLKNEITLGMK